MTDASAWLDIFDSYSDSDTILTRLCARDLLKDVERTRTGCLGISRRTERVAVKATGREKTAHFVQSLLDGWCRMVHFLQNEFSATSITDRRDLSTCTRLTFTRFRGGLRDSDSTSNTAGPFLTR